MALSISHTLVQSLLILGIATVVSGSFFVSTHQKGRYVKPPSSGKRAVVDSQSVDPLNSLVYVKENEDLAETMTAEEEKRACRLILKTIDVNLDHIMSEADLIKENSSAPFQRAIRYIGRNLNLLEKCLNRLGDQ